MGDVSLTVESCFAVAAGNNGPCGAGGDGLLCGCDFVTFLGGGGGGEWLLSAFLRGRGCVFGGR